MITLKSCFALSQIMEFLLRQADTDVNLERMLATPLQRAIRGNHTRLVGYLLALDKVDVNAVSSKDAL